MKGVEKVMKPKLQNEAFERKKRIEENLKKIKHKIVIFSGKGGVGKTTFAVNFAYTLSKKGYKIGILDGDITGPNVPKMVGLNSPLEVTEDKRIMPANINGVFVVSLATILPPDAPVIWKGPLRSVALEQFLGDVVWKELDILVADLPPGTGDEVLTLVQTMKPDAAIIVSTPQKVARLDSSRAVNMAKTMQIKYIFLVENMSYLVCSHCGKEIDLFGKGTIETEAVRLGVNYLGSIPFDSEMRVLLDEGKSIINEKENAEITRIYRDISDKVIKTIEI